MTIRKALEQKVDEKEIEIFKKAIESKAFEFRFSDMSNVFNNFLTTGGYNANTKINDEKVLEISGKFNEEMDYASKQYIKKIKEEIV